LILARQNKIARMNVISQRAVRLGDSKIIQKGYSLESGNGDDDIVNI
jgi:hypothetical protein